MQSSTTPLEITYLHTKTLKPDPRNPRVHSDKQVRQIAQSIQTFGFNVPMPSRTARPEVILSSIRFLARELQLSLLNVQGVDATA
jgi:hypothetical protein